MEKRTVLGLDLGPHSIGWAMIEERRSGGAPGFEPASILGVGSRVFPEGVERTPQGSEISRSAKRREARSARKIHKRRRRRKDKLKLVLRENGLLPEDGEDYQALMGEEPYGLRTAGLDRRLALHDIGRVLFHICQRRGFKSNRKTDNVKETGPVLEAINELKAEIDSSGSRTLGELLYKKRLEDPTGRIRGVGHYTHRDMYIAEFEAIWEAQKAYYPETLTEELKVEVGNQTIFYQRPLKIQKHLVGSCEYERGKKRSPRGTWYAQRFRMLQDINNLAVLDRSTGELRPLIEEERDSIITTLGKKKDMTFDAVRKLLGFTEEIRFNLEEGGKKKLLGNKTEWELRQVYKKDYGSLAQDMRDEIIYDILFIESESLIIDHAADRWGLDPDRIKRLLKARPESGYLHLSEKAIKRLLPFMEAGAMYMDAVSEAGYKRRDELEVETTPILMGKDIPKLTNPLVRSALNQVRRVVNSITMEYGVPDIIRVEMVRDLKKGAKERDRIKKTQRENERLNKNAWERLVNEFGFTRPSRDDLIKYKLWEECEHECPYTGKQIPKGALFGGDFEIEHIIPYSRSLEDTYMNKTLCYTRENRIKLNKTPWEQYAHDIQRWEAEILKRIKRLPAAKRRRFMMRDLPDDFINRKLTDTAYIACEVRSYLEKLSGKNKVKIATGLTTGLLRKLWGLHTVLGRADKKNRDDHRHHAVDAVVVALTTDGAIKRLSKMSRGRRNISLRDFPAPWASFRDDVQKKVDSIVVSHKVSRKVAGALHEETNYGRLKQVGKGEVRLYALRKPVTVITKSELSHIADDRIRELIKTHLVEHGVDLDVNTEKDKVWKEAITKTVYLPNKNGAPVPIKRVRIHKPSSAMIDLGCRSVKSGSNHHIVIYEHTDGVKKGRWDGEVVSTFEAARRVKDKEEVILRDVGEGKRFVMSLSINEMVSIGTGEDLEYYRVQVIDGASKQITLRLHTAATIQNKKERLIKIPNAIRIANGIKVTVDPIGRVWRAND